MLKKKFSLVTALIMMITLFVGQMPSAWAKVGFVADGYEIIDSAYGNGTYVVMAKKSSDYSAAKIYTSKDGRTWTETFTSASATNSAAKDSRQELTYWDSQNLFVTAVGNSIYTSSNGITWTVNEDLYVTSNMIVESKNGLLVVAARNKAKIATSLEEISSVDCYESSNYYVSLIMIESDSKIYFNSAWTRGVVEKTEEGWSRTSNSNENPAQNVIDAKRVSGETKWLTLLSNKTTLSVAVSGGNYSPKQFTPLLADGANEAVITAVGADAETLFFGTTNGKIYSISSSANLVATEDVPADVWTEISPADGTTAIAEKVTDINKINADTFLVTTATGVYSMTKTGTGYTYSDMLSYKTIEEAKITGMLPFADSIEILGGVYSEKLKKYIIYGNDKNSYTANGQTVSGKAHIYSSTDGINWVEDEFSLPNGNRPPAFTTKVKNNAVYWDAQNVFVIGGLDRNGGYAMCLTLKDDETKWVYRNMNVGNEGDIALINNNLYSTLYTKLKEINKYSELGGTAELVQYSESDVSYNLNNMAISDDEQYLFLSHETGRTYLYNLKTKTQIKNVSPDMRDAHWNNSLQSFVAIQNNANKNMIMILGVNGSVVKAATPSQGNLTAVHTNGSNYVTGDTLGKLYKTGTNLSASSVFTEIQPVSDGTANTLPVTNIFKGADNKYFVTVSDGNESDVLIVNADGSAYAKVSELTTPTSIKAGDSFRVSVKTENYTETAAKLSMIVGIYTADGTKLLQAAAEDKTMAVDSEAYLTMDVTADTTIPEGAKVKVFLWDSVNGMKPVAGEAKSFF